MDENLQELMDTVVQNDYCIGCGVCASISETSITMKMNEDGKYNPVLTDAIENINLKIDPLTVCPFSNNANNETHIGEKVFSQFNNIKFNDYTGFYLKSYAGYVKEGDYREKGSSGGVGNWIASKLLQNKLIDGVIHVKEVNYDNGILFEYQISNNLSELMEGAKSKYYPIEMSKVLQLVRENEGRYALIGIPCFIKSIRLLAEKDEIIKQRIKYFIGLVCGHLKSDLFAKSIGWELGIEPNNLINIDFRKKLKDKSANNYGVEVVGKKNGEIVEVSSPTKDLYTTNWGHGLFKYKACEYCDDVLGETADITVGDAWLPEYSKDSMGTNIIVIRNPEILKIFESNQEILNIEEISAEKVYQSQAGGFRHRRDGLAYRLYLTDLKNEWRPEKRVKASNEETSKRKQTYEKRMVLMQESFKAYKEAEKKGDFNSFINHMSPFINEYNKMSAPSFPKRVFRKIKRGFTKLFKNK